MFQGLGVSVEHPNNYFSQEILRHWDEAASSDMEQVNDVTAQVRGARNEFILIGMVRYTSLTLYQGDI